MQRFRNQHLNVGTPCRALLARGDVIIAHQRLAHVAGFNRHTLLTRKNVYFRVERTDFASFADTYVKSPHPWVSFSGLSDLLPNGVSTEIPLDNVHVRSLLSAHALTRSDKHLSAEQQMAFMRDGFVHVKSAVSNALCEKALSKVRNAMDNGKYNVNQRGQLVFNTHVGCGLALTDVLLKSGLVNLVEDLLGPENCVLLDSKADIIVKQIPNGQDQELDPTEMVRKGGWDIGLGKGRYWRQGMDHVVRAAVALSDQLNADENRGQITVWPGTLVYFKKDIFLKDKRLEKDLVDCLSN